MLFQIKRQGILNANWVLFQDGIEVATLKKVGFLRQSGIITIGASSYSFKFIWYKNNYSIFDSMGSLIGSYKSKELKKTMWSLEGVAEVNGKMFEFTTLRDERKISCTTNGQQVFEISLSIDSQDLLGDTDVIINVDAELNRLILMLIWGLR